ncbi:competence CoiA family protein [Streptomyces sp. SID14515]|nr:competence CoiA family protein [Streptomyces sp. SID14515]
MSAVLRGGTRFFAHNGKRPEDCPLENESFEHHMTKLVLLGAIRDAGWHAELEVSAPDKSWRADVMATSPDGSQLMAWEAQLSPITIEHIKERTDRYTQAGIRVCWVSPHEQAPKWIDEAPAVQALASEAGGNWSVNDGVAAFNWSFGAWGVRVTPLPEFVRWALEGQVEPVVSLRRYHRVKRRVLRRGMWWTSANSARLQTEHEAMRRRQEEKKRAAEEARLAAQAEIERVRQEEAARESARRAAEVEEINRRSRQPEAERHARWLKERAQQVAQREREVAEAEERRLREEAEAAVRVLRAEEASRAWWSPLSSEQVQEFFRAVAARARQKQQVQLRIPEEPYTELRYGHGAPLITTDGHVYGVARPCPEVAVPSHALRQVRVFLRNRAEANLLGDLECKELVVLDLPDHEQLRFG